MSTIEHEKSIEESEKRYRRLFEAAQDGILILDGRTGAIVDANPFLVESIGYSRDELLGKMLWEIGAFVDVEASRRAFAELESKGYARYEDLELQRKDGSRLEVEFISSAYDVGDVRAYQCQIRDISDRRRAERALAESELRYRSLFENVSDEISIIDLDGTIRYVSDSIREASGFEPWDVVGRNFFDVVDPRDREAARSAMTALVAHPCELLRFELRRLRKDGSSCDVESVARNLLETRGIGGIVLSTRDVTARRRAEADIVAGAHRFHAMIENAVDVIAVVDVHGVLTYVSPSIQALAGYTPEETLGRNILDFAHPASQDDFRSSFSKLLQEPDAVDRRDRWYRNKDGSLRLFESVARNLLHDPAVAGIVVNLRDITERVAGLAARERLAAMVEGSNDAILGTTLEGIITDWNRAAEQLYGYSRDEAIGRSVTVLVAPEQQSDVERQIARLAAGEPIPNDEGVGVRKDGARFDYHFSLSYLRDPHGTPIGITAIVRDISSRKAQEHALQRVNRALRTLSASNSVLVHATSERQIVQDICNVVVNQGGYKAAWVCFAEHDDARTLRPVAWAGVDADYIRRLDVTWADTERGRGISGSCIRSGTWQVARDIESDPLMAPWRDEAIKRGHMSSAAFPLMGTGGAFGVAVIVAGERDAFDADELALLSEMSSDLAYGLGALRTAEKHVQGLFRLERSMEGTVRALAGTVEARDPYTAGHQRRVAAIATAIAGELGMTDYAVHGLSLAAAIHDIGKINIPAEILSKPGKLTALEFELVKTHAESGYQILKDVEFPWPVAEIVRQHHERPDGKGYPRGLVARQILPEAKILAVADVVEAMSSHRPYRPGLGVDATLAEVAKMRGVAFDADAVDACLRLFREKGFKIPE